MERNTITSVTFTAEDLEHNRRGEMSPRQRAQLREESVGCLGILGLFVGLCALAIAARAWLNDRQQLEIIITFGVAGGVALLVIGAIVRGWWERPQAVRGTFEVVVDRSKSYNHKHNIIVGTTVFHTDHLLPRALEQGATYAFYFRGTIPRKILSYEKVADASTGLPAA